MPTIDPTAQRAALERQYALLLPVLQHLQVEAAASRVVLDDTWTGPAAQSAAALVAELDRRLASAADEVDDFLRTVRLALGALA